MSIWDMKEGQSFVHRVPAQLAEIANALNQRNKLLELQNTLLQQLIGKGDMKMPTDHWEPEETMDLPL